MELRSRKTKRQGGRRQKTMMTMMNGLIEADLERGLKFIPAQSSLVMIYCACIWQEGSGKRIGGDGIEIKDKVRSMAETPPPFQEASRCDICNCSFNTFRRRHHCRCCGRTLCHEHSSNYMTLPQFGISSDVRVCPDCFNNSSRFQKDNKQTSPNTSNGADNSFSRLTLDEKAVLLAKTTPEESAAGVLECKCGMPLCICVAPTPEPIPIQNTTSISNTKPKKASSQKPTESISMKHASTSSRNPSPFFNHSQASNLAIDKACANYEVSGEGLREAIKNSDATAVKELLSKGVDPNYCDKQGLTLLHLAAVFNQTEIAFILMDHGASTESKNAQGETPVDCAPTMLQYKMRKKMEELVSIG